MKPSFAIIAAFALVAAQSTAVADSRIARLCGEGHANEVASATDVSPNPAGYYVASLREQISTGDPRIILTTDDEFFLCTRPAATPAMDVTKALLLMNKRTVRYLFVPVMPSPASGSS